MNGIEFRPVAIAMALVVLFLGSLIGARALARWKAKHEFERARRRARRLRDQYGGRGGCVVEISASVDGENWVSLNPDWYSGMTLFEEEMSAKGGSGDDDRGAGRVDAAKLEPFDDWAKGQDWNW